MLTRTFGCVRVVWNLTLATRRARWRTARKGTSYAQTDRALTILKKDPDLAFLNEVSAVPLQQALRHQQAAFAAFFQKRARLSAVQITAEPPVRHVHPDSLPHQEGGVVAAENRRSAAVRMDLAGYRPS